MSGNNYRMFTIVILYEAQIILGSSNCLQIPNLSSSHRQVTWKLAANYIGVKQTRKHWKQNCIIISSTLKGYVSCYCCCYSYVTNLQNGPEGPISPPEGPEGPLRWPEGPLGARRAPQPSAGARRRGAERPALLVIKIRKSLKYGIWGIYLEDFIYF